MTFSDLLFGGSNWAISDVSLVQIEDNMKLTEMFFFHIYFPYRLCCMLSYRLCCMLSYAPYIHNPGYQYNNSHEPSNVKWMKANIFPLILKDDKRSNVPLQSYQLMLVVSMINLFFHLIIKHLIICLRTLSAFFPKCELLIITPVSRPIHILPKE